MSDRITAYQHLAPNPKSSYKQLFVKGTRIRARVLYGWSACQEPMTAEEIAREFAVPVEAIREAITYCESNPPELLDDYFDALQERGVRRVRVTVDSDPLLFLVPGKD